MRISVITFSRDSVDQVLGLIKEVHGAVDEIILVDSSNKENREKLRLEKERSKLGKLKIFYVVPLGFVETVRTYALTKCKGDWVLYLDSDERISEALKRDLKKVVAGATADAYVIKRYEDTAENLGKGNVFTWQTRLYKRKAVHYKGIVDEQPEIDGKAKRLEDEDYYIGHVLSLQRHSSNEYYRLGNKFTKYERLSYSDFNGKLVRYMYGSGTVADILGAYENIGKKGGDEEISNTDYYIYYLLKYIGFMMVDKRIWNFPLCFQKASAMKKLFSERRGTAEGDEEYKISQLISKVGMVKFLGLNKENVIRRLNKEYADDKKGMSGLALLVHLLQQRYRETNGKIDG